MTTTTTLLVVTLIVLASLVLSECRYRRRYSTYPNPPPKTRGVPWPLPSKYSTTGQVFQVDGVSFEFIATGQTCTTLQEAFRRYYRLMFNHNYSGRGSDWSDSNDVVVDSLSVDVNVCDDVYPTSSSDESCKYNVVIMFD